MLIYCMTETLSIQNIAEIAFGAASQAPCLGSCVASPRMTKEAAEVLGSCVASPRMTISGYI